MLGPQARLGNGDIRRFALDAEKAALLLDAGQSGRPRASKGVKDDATGRRDEAHEPAHEGDRLHGWMMVAGTARPARTSARTVQARASVLAVGGLAGRPLRQILAAALALVARRLRAVEEA